MFTEEFIKNIIWLIQYELNNIGFLDSEIKKSQNEIEEQKIYPQMMNLIL